MDLYDDHHIEERTSADAGYKIVSVLDLSEVLQRGIAQ